jgi:hypothetical protein
VWKANAPRIAVHLNADSAAGLTVPALSCEAKQKIPFTLTYTPTNQEYAVVQWAASLGEVDTGIINTPIVVRFSKDIRPESFIHHYENGEPKFRNDAGEFKNITIQGSSDFGNGRPVNYARYFFDPVLEDNTLKLEVDIDYARAHPPGFSYIYVTLEQGITSTDHQTLPAPARFQYSVNDIFDDTGPVIRRFSASLNKVTEAPQDKIQRWVKPGDVIYLIISAFDQITRTDLHDVYITDTSLDPGTATERFWYTEEYNNELWMALVADTEKNHGDTLPGIFIFEYTIKPGKAGSIDLQAEICDAWGNRSSAAIYSFYRINE